MEIAATASVELAVTAAPSTSTSASWGGRQLSITTSPRSASFLPLECVARAKRAFSTEDTVTTLNPSARAWITDS